MKQNITEEEKNRIRKMHNTSLDEGFLDDAFSDSVVKNLVKQSRHKYDDTIFTLKVLEPFEIIDDDESLMYKIKRLLDANDIKYEFIEEEKE